MNSKFLKAKAKKDKFLGKYAQNTYSDTGFGTFYPYISGTDLKVDFVPVVIYFVL